MRKFRVLTEVCLGYGSHTRNPNPSSVVFHKPGTILVLDSEAPNGNVWFIDPEGQRGKIECGSVDNIIKRGRVEEIL